MVSFKHITTLVFTLSAYAGWGQNQLTLDSCINQGYRNFRFTEQSNYNAQIADINEKRIGKSYLPTLELNAISTYQNEQITIPVNLPIPGFEAPAAPLNLNSALFSLRQYIYDGSMSANQKVIQQNAGKVAVQEVEVQKLELKTKITQLYFSILLLQKQAEILDAKRTVLQARLKEVETAVQNGVLLVSDKQLLQAELVQLKQRIAEVHFNKKESMAALEQLTGLNIEETTLFAEPVAEIAVDNSLENRPDLLLLNYNSELLEAQKDLTKSTYLPKIGVFADGGFGLPGYDIFNDAISPMYRVGITLNWKIFDWQQGNLQRQSLSMNQQIISLKKDQLKSQVGVQTATQLNNVEKAKTLMQDDAELVNLYTSVSAAYANQLENGTITSAEYILQLNKQQEAMLNLELHKLQLLVATINYNTLLGK